MKISYFVFWSAFICFLVACPVVVSAADDGEVYVVAMDNKGNSHYLESLAGGKFAEQEPLGQVVGASYGNGIGDFDNDGDLDYITASGYRSISVYLFEKIQPGNEFAAPAEVGSWNGGDYPADIAVADFNEDGNLDFVLTLYTGTDCALFTGDGRLGFTRSLIAGSAFTYSIGADAADFNNDGHADFVVAPASFYDYLQFFYVNLGHGDGTFTTVKYKGHGSGRYWGVAAGDYDGDGIADLAATRNGFIDVYLGVGDGTFDQGASIVEPNVYYYSPVDNYDFDGDGIQDIAIGTFGTEHTQRNQAIGVFRGDGEGRFIYSEIIWGGSNDPCYALTAPPPMADNIDPVAIINPGHQTVTAGEAVLFNGDVSFDEDGEVVCYAWDFGDQSLNRGHACRESSAQHVFYETGLYTITLTVTDNMGATNSAEAQVRVEPLPVKVWFTPGIIKPGRGPRWVRANIWLPDGYDASKVDPGSVCVIENQTPVLYACPRLAGKRFSRFFGEIGSRRCMVKFERQRLLTLLDGAAAGKTLLVQGKLSHNGGLISFEGSGTMRKIEPRRIIKPDNADIADKKHKRSGRMIKKLYRKLCSLLWSRR